MNTTDTGMSAVVFNFILIKIKILKKLSCDYVNTHTMNEWKDWDVILHRDSYITFKHETDDGPCWNLSKKGY